MQIVAYLKPSVDAATAETMRGQIAAIEVADLQAMQSSQVAALLPETRGVSLEAIQRQLGIE